MHRVVYLFFSIGASCVACVARAETPCQSILSNGSFEEGQLLEGSNKYQPALIPGWQLTGTIRHGTSPQAFEILKNAPRAGTDGVAYLDLDSSESVFDEISQQVTTEANCDYELSFDISRPNISSTGFASSLDVYWDADAEARVGAIDESRAVTWVHRTVKLSSGAGGIKRLAFREIAEGGKFDAGDGRGPLLDNVRLCKVGETGPATGAAKGAPINKRNPVSVGSGTNMAPWVLPDSIIETFNDAPRELSFNGASPITDFEDPAVAARTFLQAYQSQLQLDGIASQLGTPEILESDGWRVVFEQVFEGVGTNRFVRFNFTAAKKLTSVEFTARRILSSEAIAFPTDFTAAIAAAVTHVRAEHVADPQAEIKRFVFVRPNGAAVPAFQVFLNNRAIMWVVGMHAQTNEVFFAERL